MGTRTTSSNTNAHDPGIKDFAFLEIENRKGVLERLFKASNAPALVQKNTYVADNYPASIPVLTNEGATIPNTEQGDGYKTTINVHKFAQSLIYTREEMSYDLSGVVKQRAKDFARGVSIKLEKIRASVLNNCLTTDETQATEVTSYNDGKNLGSTVHPTPVTGVSTMSNVSGSGITMSESNLDTLIQAARAQTDMRGELLGVSPDLIVIPPELLKKTIEITKSDKRSESLDNDINAYQHGAYFTGGRMDILMSDYLTSATRWFLFDENIAKLFLSFAKDGNIKVEGPDWNFNSEIATYKVTYIIGVGFLNWRGVQISTGTGATYTY